MSFVFVSEGTDRPATEWLDQRIQEVVDGIGDSDVVSSSCTATMSRKGRMVVAMKLRMSAGEWIFLKNQMHSWIPRGIEGKFMARYEADYPNWYGSFTPSVMGDSYNPNMRFGK